MVRFYRRSGSGNCIDVAVGVLVLQKGEVMKQDKKLNREYKIAVSAYGLDPAHWMLREDGDPYILIVHKDSRKTRRVDKYAKPRKGN